MTWDVTTGETLFESRRLRFRRVTEADAAGPYRLWMNDATVTRYLEARGRAYSESDLRAYVKRIAANPDALFMAIVAKDDGMHIGNIKLEPIIRRHRRAEMGIVIGVGDRRGRGLGAEAIAATVEYAFNDLGLCRITAGVYAPNLASLKAFLRAGFREEGRRPFHWRLDDRWADDILLGRVRPDLEAMFNRQSAEQHRGC